MNRVGPNTIRSHVKLNSSVNGDDKDPNQISHMLTKIVE